VRDGETVEEFNRVSYRNERIVELRPDIPSRVISGCQTGADRGALIWAQRRGIVTGGYMPLHFRAEDGMRKDLAEEFGLEQVNSSAYPPRTRMNVESSSVTMIFGNPRSRGCKLTIKYCIELKVPYVHVYWSSTTGYGPSAHFAQAINNARKDLRTARRQVNAFIPDFWILNVAGNRESRQPGIQREVQVFLDCVFFGYGDWNRLDAIRRAQEDDERRTGVVEKKVGLPL